MVPPQSTSVSFPFLNPSVQVGAEHVPLAQTLSMQSEPIEHILKSGHGEQFGPPQSTSVSPSSCTPSVHDACTHRFVLVHESPIMQSELFRHCTQLPLPSHTVPPAAEVHAIPIGCGVVSGPFESQMPRRQGLTDMGGLFWSGTDVTWPSPSQAMSVQFPEGSFLRTIMGTFCVLHVLFSHVACTHWFGGGGQFAMVMQPPIPPPPVAVPVPPVPRVPLVMWLAELIVPAPPFPVPPGPSKVPIRSVQLEVTAAMRAPPTSHARPRESPAENVLRVAIRSSPRR
jgi:hypothetical protein